jgi:hypothetical protein
MIFTNPRTIDKKKKTTSFIMPSFNSKPILRKSSDIKHVVRKEHITPTTAKLVWGPPIWYFFHTIAHKIKENSYSFLKNDLYNQILQVCSNLPCPTCSKHASQYFESVDQRKLQTKQDFKLMLFQFHNVVNKKLGKQEFSLNELDTKYESANFNNILSSFFHFFEDKHKSVHMLSNDMYTQRISNKMREWYKKNYEHFI